MACIQHNTQLNHLVIDLGCSLLQFVGEVSPWTPAHATAARETLTRLLQQQQHHTEQLVELLTDRRYPVEFGVYPANFTDLHFLSLKAMLPRIIENQDAIIAELDEAVHTCVDDAEAIRVLTTVLAGERELTAALKALVV
ncbi:MAG: hypothetical protein JSS49_04040 [Planctomycetes bacterium]|nr:hypothetical protein [Planctomycetota bacterium]